MLVDVQIITSQRGFIRRWCSDLETPQPVDYYGDIADDVITEDSNWFDLHDEANELYCEGEVARQNGDMDRYNRMMDLGADAQSFVHNVLEMFEEDFMLDMTGNLDARV